MLNHNEMTRYAFISHMEDYIKKLLTDPTKADTDDFLKYHKIDGPKALSLLTKCSNPEDENSAILIKIVGIKDNGRDEEGNKLRDSFTIKYKVPRKDYTKKMRNLYISLFESNIVDNNQLNEGAWGYGILDNDSALDNQTKFGRYALSLLTHKITSSKTTDEKWANLGVLVDFIKKYDDDEIRFTDEYSSAIELCKNTTLELQQDEKFISSWSDPTKIKSELRKIHREVVNIYYDKDRLNEDGEGGGATSADASGQFTQPLFGKPIKRKTMYITQEQKEYIKKITENNIQGTAKLAPNGKPSNLPPNLWTIVRTPQFKAWFGDWEQSPQSASKIVDENGEPLIVYHGTNGNFTSFNINHFGSTSDSGSMGKGFYFTPHKDYASRYGKNVMSVFLNIRNPLSEDDELKCFVLGSTTVEDVYLRWKKMVEMGLADEETFAQLKPYITPEFIQDANTHDGVVPKNIYKTAAEIVAVSPKQIKSISSAAFSNDSDDIMTESNTKTMYITQEQQEYLKNIVREESVMDTQCGDFGFDAPIGDGKKNKNNKFFASANDHKNIMKKSWPNE